MDFILDYISIPEYSFCENITGLGQFFKSCQSVFLFENTSKFRFLSEIPEVKSKHRIYSYLLEKYFSILGIESQNRCNIV